MYTSLTRKKKSAFFRKILINVLQSYLFLSSTGFDDHATPLELIVTDYFQKLHLYLPGQFIKVNTFGV